MFKSDSTIKWVQHRSIKGPATCHGCVISCPSSWFDCLTVCLRKCVYVRERFCVCDRNVKQQQTARWSFSHSLFIIILMAQDWMNGEAEERRKGAKNDEVTQVQNKAADPNTSYVPCSVCTELEWPLNYWVVNHQHMGLPENKIMNLQRK